ncbi:hypothetical protein [Tenuifilum thalassicum]|uniref:Lipocalin family protein n=1 Tax=Tenuifilum thalassicum TaxID=2590900 RepID=A0A7D3XDY5_9BACT|nr:hypothetical protein [Tenuifilum thalassicum]QKG79487.1 hypothetical protein FHG85_04120 [Tenuifilum thalassicum]
MKKLVKTIAFALLGITLLGSSCDKYEQGEGVTGVWLCREYYSGSKYRTYNVSIDRYTQLDSNTYVVYNMYNLGLNVETYIHLSDTVFSIIGTNSDMYYFTGKGTWHKAAQVIEWEYSVSGQVSDPYVNAVFERP